MNIFDVLKSKYVSLFVTNDCAYYFREFSDYMEH